MSKKCVDKKHRGRYMNAYAACKSLPLCLSLFLSYSLCRSFTHTLAPNRNLCGSSIEKCVNLQTGFNYIMHTKDTLFLSESLCHFHSLGPWTNTTSFVCVQLMRFNEHMTNIPNIGQLTEKYTLSPALFSSYALFLSLPSIFSFLPVSLPLSCIYSHRGPSLSSTLHRSQTC